MKRLWHFMVRVDVVSLLILVAALLTIFGSLFPQIPASMESDLQRTTAWEQETSGRYGRLKVLFESLGVFRFYRSPIFILALSLLGISTLFCILNRWKALWRKAFHREVRCSDAVFDVWDHATTTIVESTAGFLPELQKKLLDHGFHSQMTSEKEIVHLRADRYRLSPLATLVSHLSVVLLLTGVLLSCAFSWREEITIGPNQPAILAGQNGTTLYYEGFTIERYPDGSVLSYQAKIRFADKAGADVQNIIRVNEPITYNGVSVNLQGFSQAESGETLNLLVVHDPGYAVVITAAFLLFLGMTVSFNFPRGRLFARAKPDGIVRLAAQVDRRTHPFDREFATLISEIKTVAAFSKGDQP
ncbi:MAG: cytochrome c biogenesis protein ResB [Chloroflexota bacterium]